RDAASGAFEEALTVDGRPVSAPRRARVQARQAFVYASAAEAGLGADWLAAAERGFVFYRAHYQRPDGQFAILADRAGRVLDDTPCLYEQAFSLLAMAALQAAGSKAEDYRTQAERLLDALQGSRHRAGGFRELTG